MLGLIQGATEFAPISSSGHLILVPWAFGWDIVQNPDLNKSFDVALHIGTLVGALAYFRREVVRYTIAASTSIRMRSIRTMDERVAWALAFGTIPGVIVGASLEGVIQQYLGAPWLIAAALAIFGVILYLVDRVAAQRRDLGDLQVREGLFLGIAQALALQPGVSRSGVTITAARAMAFDRGSAARFSFLLSLPIIAGAGIYKGTDLLSDGIPPGMGWPFLWGMAASAVSGFLVIWFLLRYLRRHDFAVFMWYRIGVAAVVFGLIATGIRPATI